MSDALHAARERIIVALDVARAEDAVAWARTLRGQVGLFKIGLELFVAEGPKVVDAVRTEAPESGIFLDLKLHDIPNTMRGAIRGIRRLGVRFLTVHAGSGIDHLRACVDEAKDELGILAVTVLTSQDERACREAGHTRTPGELVVIRAQSAAAAGCAGIVCSGLELGSVRAAEPDLTCVVPGIRPHGGDDADQKRVMTPSEAIAAGARYLVIGRPITQARDPVAVVSDVAAEIAKARASHPV